jgi:inhibitor of KinA
MLSNSRFSPMGDLALIIEFGTTIDPGLSAAIASAAHRLQASPPPGVTDIVPAYTTLTLHYDPAQIGAGTTPFDALVEQLAAWLRAETVAPTLPGRTIEIPVCYGGHFGEDLQPLAASLGMSAEELVRIHSGGTYPVHMLGFVPGFAYLGGLDPRIAAPRRDKPRTRVPAGSVAIGGKQTGVYPLETPGGWQLIGRTPIALFTPEAPTPCLLAAGDTVRFVPITAQEFAELSGVRQ